MEESVTMVSDSEKASKRATWWKASFEAFLPCVSLEQLKMASSSFSVGKQQRGKLQHQIHIRYVVTFVFSFHSLNSLFSLDDSDQEDPLDIVKLAWMDTWKTESYENLFQGLLEPQISCREGKASGYIDPDTIHCPLLLRGKNPKIHILKIPIFTKFTFLKSQFSQNSHF